MNNTIKIILITLLLLTTIASILIHNNHSIDESAIYWTTSIFGIISIVIAAFLIVDLALNRMYGLSNYHNYEGRYLAIEIESEIE